MKQAIDRRALLRTLAYGFGALTLGRLASACSAPAVPSSNDVDGTPGRGGTNNNNNGSDGSPAPTDNDEHVPGKSTPVETNDAAPKVPVQSWESRAKQLESEQQRVWGRAAFARGDAGALTGKEASHVPIASIVLDQAVARVEVTVEHVMGTNGLDAGASAAPPDAGKTLNALVDDDAGEADSGAIDASGPVEAGPTTPPPVHYITTIYLRAMVNGKDTVVGLWEFASTDAAPPTVRFPLPDGVTSVTAYEWCTLHGLWKSAALKVG